MRFYLSAAGNKEVQVYQKGRTFKPESIMTEANLSVMQDII